MEDLIEKKLIKFILNTNKDKSSHWKKYLNERSDYQNKFSHLGFGSYTLKSYKDVFHYILQKLVFGSEIFRSDIFQKYKTIFDKNKRLIDTDTIRHIFTFEKLKKITNPKKICIIGDGKINGILGAHLTFPDAKIFSVNLSETLINDYKILNELDIALKNSIELVEDLEFKTSNKILHLIPSHLKNYLMDKDIDLFINIASFQEMNMNEISQYFQIIKNNKSKLYCCNREYKKLIGSEELYFKNYPWENPRKIFWEDCPWHQKFYALRPPFVRKYNGNTIHCLVEYL